MRIAVAILALPLLLAACTAAPAPAAPTPLAGDDAHDACLLGTWKSAPGEVGAFVDQLVNAQFGGVEGLGLTSTAADGSMIITFADDGTFLYQPDLTFTLVGKHGAAQTGSVTGEASGDWRTDDGQLFGTAESEDVTLTVQVGADVSTSDSFGWTVVPITTSDYTCADDALTLEVIMPDLVYPMDFVPAT